MIEAMTYRQGHHSTSDDSSRYRDVDEVQAAQDVTDPILRMDKFLSHYGWVDINAVASIGDEERAAVHFFGWRRPRLVHHQSWKPCLRMCIMRNHLIWFDRKGSWCSIWTSTVLLMTDRNGVCLGNSNNVSRLYVKKRRNHGWHPGELGRSVADWYSYQRASRSTYIIIVTLLWLSGLESSTKIVHR